MRMILILFDPLSRQVLSEDGSSASACANFDRLRERGITFDNHYTGSLPCIPARRDLHTGRLSFLHRSWGPLEPFDNSFPALLWAAGIYTHLICDNRHYFEAGGSGYHQRFSSWEFVDSPSTRHCSAKDSSCSFVDSRSARCFDRGLEFLENNCSHDRWYLQIETMGPPSGLVSPLDAVHGAAIERWDKLLGRVLRYIDQHRMWENTIIMLVGGHGCARDHARRGNERTAQCYEIARLPLIIYHPDYAHLAGGRRGGLSQSIDLMPTILDLFSVAVPKEVVGRSLLPLMARDGKGRDFVACGEFGEATAVSDGRYLYFRFSSDGDSDGLFEYTLMPTHLNDFLGRRELERVQLVDGLPFTRGFPLLKLPAKRNAQRSGNERSEHTALYDLSIDTGQAVPICNDDVEGRMMRGMLEVLRLHDAPPEAFSRLGLMWPA